MMKVNLLFIQWDSYFGGIEKISKLYEEKFSSYNPLIVILRSTKNGFTYKNSYTFKEKKNYKFIIKYFFLIRNYRRGIFHLQYTGTTILLVTFLAGVKKIIYHFHGTQFPHKSINKWIWWFMEKKTVVIANSHHTEVVIRKKLGLKRKVEIIPNFIDKNHFRFIQRSYFDSKFTITYAGRFDKGKNLDLIIDVSKALKEIDRKIEFIFAGDGPEKEKIEKKISDNQLESFIKIIPYTNDILKLYHQSHLFIFASLHESFGNVIAEAILSGLPVLCYKIPALEELINDDFFFFTDQDPELIAKKIIKIKDNYSNVNERMKNVYDYLKKYLNEDEIISKLNNIYQSFSS